MRGGDWSIGHIYARAKSNIPALKPNYMLIYSAIHEGDNKALLASQGKDLEILIMQKHYGGCHDQPGSGPLDHDWPTYKALVKYVIIPLYAQRIELHGEN